MLARLRRWWRGRQWREVQCRTCTTRMWGYGFWPDSECTFCEAARHDAWLADLKASGKIRY